MIKRIYRVRIKPGLRAEFEPLFETVALASVAQAKGCQQVTLGWLTSHAPDDDSVVSCCDSAGSLQAFAGSDWSVPHIPEGMERCVDTCWLHHEPQPGPERPSPGTGEERRFMVELSQAGLHKG